MRAAKTNGLQRERARLSATLGANHPRVAALSRQLEANRALTRAVALEADRATTELPPRDAQTWVVHGRVLTQELTGIPHLTVALYDASGTWVEALGYTCTESNGYFKLATDRSALPTGRQVFLRVLNMQGEHVYVDPIPLTPELGRVEYREIRLASEAPVCAPPPAPNRREPVPEPNSWVVRGRVTDEAGRGRGGLTVSLYDADLFFDDRLGQTETDANGYYSFTYPTDAFSDLIERQPDLYLKVMDPAGQTLFTSDATIRFEASRVEIMNVTLRR